MKSIHRLLVVGAAAVLVGSCSTSPSTKNSARQTKTAASAKQRFVDTVNTRCDKLEPEVIRVTHGGGLDIPATQYLKDWPAHHRALTAFDTSLAAVSLPSTARSQADALHY